VKSRINELKDKMNTSGRVFYHEKSEVLYLNWSGSAVEFDFMGSELSVDFVAIAGIEYEGIPGDTTAPFHENWPFFAICIDGEITEKIYVDEKKKTVSFEKVCDGARHTLRIIKLTENLKTELGVSAISFEGEIEKPVSTDLPSDEGQDSRPRVEFIGDSITCGFGNMVFDNAPLFYTKDEDETNAHGYLAAKELGFDYSIVSISGICSTAYDTLPMEYAMDEVYEYTDRVIEEMLDGKKDGAELKKFDFEANHNDFVVINLGTNDGTAITFASDTEKQMEKFYKGYRNFVELVRKCNGKDTYIICALGSMSYYLYSDVEKIVAKYVEETGDKNISCFRYVPINVMDGMGTVGHPCRTTQEKMGREIAGEIRRIQVEKQN